MPSSEPVQYLLERLHKPKRSGRGWIAQCPAHKDRSASLSVSEGADGRALLRCFAGCDALSVVHALGLELKDLFIATPKNLSPAARSELREVQRQSGWAAALRVLSREATVVAIAGRDVSKGKALTEGDLDRVNLALNRIEHCREVLA